MMRFQIRRRLQMVFQYAPWLLLLFAVDAFAVMLLWLADARALYAMAVVVVLATVFLFFFVAVMLIRIEQKKSHAFTEFLNQPDAYHEKLLLKTAGKAQEEYLCMLGSLLREKQREQMRLTAQLNGYEEYVEGWAHEIKTPLSLLTLLLDNRRDELPDTVSHKLDHIRSRMQESVDQMLFYARLKGGRKDYQFEHISLGSCVAELLEDYRPLLEERQFQIQCCLEEDVVYADRRGLRFLLGQVISNSLKYCAAEPELRIASFLQDGCHVLSIRDNGIGVRACDLPFIFEKGFTGETGDARKKATGMGLYLASEIAKEMRISLKADAVWGKGFEMQAFFPVVDAVPIKSDDVPEKR